MKTNKGAHVPGLIIIIALLAEYAVMMLGLFKTKFFPELYLGIMGLAIFLFILLVSILVWNFRKFGRFLIGLILAALFIAVSTFGSLSIYKGLDALNKITSRNSQITNMGVFVNADDPAAVLEDTKDYKFGIMTKLDRENVDQAVDKVNEKLGSQIQVTEYDGIKSVFDALLTHEVDAILINSAYIDVQSDVEGYETLWEQIRLVESIQIESQIVVNDVVKEDVNKDVFTVFVSGIDSREGLVAKSRSDVNILLTVNTKTHQVLMISTPRDYFVPLSISNGAPDKLTHAGIYGVDVSMDTLEMLYDINVDYYFRVNFGGFCNIIDTLGGVPVYSDYDFSAGNFHYNKGENILTGEQALAFARERYAFAEGDRQRGKNQMAVIMGVFNKVLSTELLKNYSELMDNVSSNFECNVPSDLISSVVKTQLSEGGSWNFVRCSVDGTGDHQVPYSMSEPAYVMIPDEATIAKAKQLYDDLYENKQIVNE